MRLVYSLRYCSAILARVTDTVCSGSSIVVVDVDYGGREGQALGLGLLSFYLTRASLHNRRHVAYEYYQAITAHQSVRI